MFQFYGSDIVQFGGQLLFGCHDVLFENRVTIKKRVRQKINWKKILLKGTSHDEYLHFCYWEFSKNFIKSFKYKIASSRCDVKFVCKN